MDTQKMLSHLALRLEDPDRNLFTDKIKWRALNTSQLIVPNLLMDEFLADLQVQDDSETVTSGKAPYTGLSKKLLRGNGSILNLKKSSGEYMNILSLGDLKKTENSLFTPDATNLPMAWMFDQGIQTLPTSITAIDVFYMKMCDPLYHPFTITEAGTPSLTAFAFNANQEVSSVDDFYNGTVIYMSGLNKYKTVSDYTGATREITVGQGEAAINLRAADGPVYFVPHIDDYMLTNLDAVTCDLEESLHDIVLMVAAAICWKEGNRLDRAGKELKSALDTIQALNQKYKVRESIGVAKN